MNTVLTLHDPSQARGYYAHGLWRDETFYSLLCKHADERPHAYALRDSTRRITWAELRRWTDATADALDAEGVAKGNRVSIWTSNRVESIVAFLACARNGYICNPSLHFNYTTEEILGLLDRIKARALIGEDGYGVEAGKHDGLAQIAGLPTMRRVFRLPKGRDSSGDFPLPGEASRTKPDTSADKVCYLAFTSGTTGAPKAVMHSDNTLMANARDLVRDWGHGPHTVLLSLSPLSHHIAWVGVAQILLCGGELALNDPPQGLKALDWAIETGATYVMGVPTHAMDIQAEQQARGLDRIGKVEVFYMAGAPIPPVVAERFLAQGIKPQNVYGMTENSSHQYTAPTDDPATICNTCGRGGSGYEVRIFSQENADIEVPAGTVGQIGGRGACLMLGYFDNQNATEDSFNRNGWFLSGDLGVLDARGNLSIVGRLKDIIIRGGHNIHPKKIEDIAHKHADIAKAAAFAVPDERLGERVCLAIMPSGGRRPEADEMLLHLYEHDLSKYDMPEYYIVMDQFPLTASGKILKRELAEWAKAGRIKPAPCRFVEPAKTRGARP